MNDRIRACSPLVALAIASVVALSACEEQSAPEPVAKVSGALSILQPGDVAVTCMFTQSDAIQITPLVPLDVGTDLKYTDREANAAGMFNSNDENPDVVLPINSPNDAGATVVPAGMSIFYTESGLGNGTEQVFLYQGLIAPTDGAATNYQLIWGLQVSPAPAADAGAQTDPGWANVRDDANNLSERPTALVGASVGLFSGAATGFAYDKTKGTSGTKAQLKALISDPTNWIQVTPTQANCPGNFTVIPDVVDSGAGNDSASDAPTGSDGGTGGMIGTVDSGTDAAADAGGGTGGMTGNDAGADTGAGGTGTGGAGSTDSGASDAKADTGSATDAKADTGSATDAKADTGKPDTGTATDAKVDTGSKADAGKDGGTTSKGSSGCSCSTASNGANIGAGAWVFALAGVLITVRRRRR
jgi:MYXO-CTERM domain-containing protein